MIKVTYKGFVIEIFKQHYTKNYWAKIFLGKTFVGNTLFTDSKEAVIKLAKKVVNEKRDKK